MTQEEINIIYNITILIHEDEWFKCKKTKSIWNIFRRQKRRDREEVQKWVARQLADIEIYTIPCGSSWGVTTTKEEFDNYWKDK